MSAGPVQTEWHINMFELLSKTENVAYKTCIRPSTHTQTHTHRQIHYEINFKTKNKEHKCLKINDIFGDNINCFMRVYLLVQKRFDS